MFRSVGRFPPFIKHLRLFSRCCPAEGRCAMGTFVPNLSPVTGKMEWVLRDEDYDYHQEIARSAYADMLHDTERNQKYYQGLRRAVEQFHAAGKAAHVLDIGTGTGLLSMMAAACGADTITACEAFQPMAHCARQVIERNGLKEKIRLIPKRSTDVTVGKDGDMPHRANILVTEVFDTELIGEGAIGTFHHAHKQLLEKDCLVVPRAANMYVQLVQSEKLRQWNQLQPIKIKGCDDVRPPAAFSKCGGAPSLHDLQLDQLPQTDFQVICQPVKVFRFDYTGKSEIKFKDQSDISVVSERDGRVDAIFMWWEIEMDPKGEITLSCAPNWDHPDPQNMQWRDHWMQAIYYPNKRRVVKEGETIRIQSHHDEYSLWFDVQERSAEMHEEDERGICTCGAHITYSRPRIAMLNHNYRNDIYMRVLKQVIGPSSVVLCLGDGSLLPVMAGRMAAKKVYTLQPNPLCRRTLQAYCEENSVESEVEILEKLPGEVTAEDIHGDRVDIVIAEPFYLTSILPWHNLQMWYALADLSSRVAPGAKVFPLTATLLFVAVEFADLWKIRAPVGVCEGFDLGIFDKLIESSSDKADAYVEPHPLWEYPSTALCQPITAMDFTLSMDVGQAQSQVVESDVKFECTGCCNGIAIWMEYNFGEDRKVSSGPVTLPIIGKPVQWDRFTRQGVHLFKEPRPISTSDTLQYKVTFYPAAGEFDFFFHINSKTSDTA